MVKGKVWQYPGPGGWHFVNLNRRDSKRIRDFPLAKTVAWGYVRVKATIGKTTWDTTLFPGKNGIYMIAIKAVVRKKENIRLDDMVQIKITTETASLFPPAQ
jgi:hypothetical protein